MINQGFKLAATAAIIFASVGANAQTSVRTVDAPYVAPRATVPAADDIPVAPSKSLDDLIGANPNLDLVAGKTVAAQLTSMAKAAGWQLIWEAADFTIEHRVTVSSDFIKAVTTVIESANVVGTRLKADFYKGNNIVRVTEF